MSGFRSSLLEFRSKLGSAGIRNVQRRRNGNHTAPIPCFLIFYHRAPHWFLISLQSSFNFLNFIRLFVNRAVGTVHGKLKFVPS